MFDINKYPKSSSAATRCRRCLQLVMTLKSRLDDAWCAIVTDDEITTNGFLYYREDLRAAAEKLVSDSTNEMSPSDYAEWLRVVAEQVMNLVSGYYPVKVLDAALAVERSLHLFRENLIDAPLKRGKS
ncbi:hypothetical protein [Bradyrhizobium sp. S3.7.6]